MPAFNHCSRGIFPFRERWASSAAVRPSWEELRWLLICRKEFKRYDRVQLIWGSSLWWGALKLRKWWGAQGWWSSRACVCMCWGGRGGGRASEAFVRGFKRQQAWAVNAELSCVVTWRAEHLDKFWPGALLFSGTCPKGKKGLSLLSKSLRTNPFQGKEQSWD